jgi:hypothetical protein
VSFSVITLSVASQRLFIVVCVYFVIDSVRRLLIHPRIATGYRLNHRGSKVRFPAGAGNFSLHHRVQTESGAHPASYPMGIGVSFPRDKAAGA